MHNEYKLMQITPVSIFLVSLFIVSIGKVIVLKASKMKISSFIWIKFLFKCAQGLSTWSDLSKKKRNILKRFAHHEKKQDQDVDVMFYTR